MQHPGEYTASCDESNTVPIEYTRTLDKAYRFFQDGHVQNIKYHPMPEIPYHVCVSAVVLPRMSPFCFKNLQPMLLKLIVSAQEDFQGAVTMLQLPFHSGLQDYEQKGCTECLQIWNQLRK